MNINIIPDFLSPEDLDIEVVERKGIGHPDTVADGIAETASVVYSRYCMKEFGIIPHHNLDKVNALGGLARIEWGSIDLIQPLRLILNGRISYQFGDRKIPVAEIYEEAAKQFLSKALPNLNLESDVRFIHEHTNYSRNPFWFAPRSIDDLPEYKVLLANDTSAVAAGSPLTLTEKLVLGLEGFFYNYDQTPKFKECGQDIKVMAIRRGKKFEFRICFPIILKYCPDVETYWEISDRILNILSLYVDSRLPNGYSFQLEVNTTKDTRKILAKEFYVVVGGSALDFGEEGLVGRGNNRNGIIPMFRTFSMEAACGKNPVYHVGKVLGVVADRISQEIYEVTGNFNEVLIVAKQGDSLLSPAQIIVKTPSLNNKSEVTKIVKEILDRKDWTSKIVDGGILIPVTGNSILNTRNANEFAI